MDAFDAELQALYESSDRTDYGEDSKASPFPEWTSESTPTSSPEATANLSSSEEEELAFIANLAASDPKSAPAVQVYVKKLNTKQLANLRRKNKKSAKERRRQFDIDLNWKLIRYAYLHMNSITHRLLPMPELVELLTPYAFDLSGDFYNPDPSHMRSVVTSDWIVGKVKRAAEYVTIHWNPNYEQDHLQWSAKGGSAGHRTPKFTGELFQKFPPEMTHAEIAELLNCSVRTVRRMKARAAAISQSEDSL